MEKPNIPTINSRGGNLGLSSSATFLLPNSYNSKDPNIEMIQIQPLTYTSLRDLLPSSPPPPCLLSSTQRSSSWKEISIKNPLVKHAARAYLQPMSTPDVDNRGLFQRLKDQCGCIRWFNDIVLKPLMVKFFGRGEEISDDEDEDDYLRRD
ncbi:hypothetical protein SADUNF_Sadunf04G0127400 [Salix dunnii]|uniref:Uncharacterized protein n=1 Tax=Salix dunnii TaxID=1413687 RepID=A0A835K9N4_9ROSI|nr:hypothetical protein SADUNF_Sadunf04G0127400 [Salix dunnii]